MGFRVLGVYGLELVYGSVDPPPVIVTTGDNGDHIRIHFCSYCYTTITGCGVHLNNKLFGSREVERVPTQLLRKS